MGCNPLKFLSSLWLSWPLSLPPTSLGLTLPATSLGLVLNLPATSYPTWTSCSSPLLHACTVLEPCLLSLGTWWGHADITLQ